MQSCCSVFETWNSSCFHKVTDSSCNGPNKKLNKPSYAWFIFHYETHLAVSPWCQGKITLLVLFISGSVGRHYSNRSLLLLQDDCGTISHEISLLFFFFVKCVFVSAGLSGVALYSGRIAVRQKSISIRSGAGVYHKLSWKGFPLSRCLITISFEYVCILMSLDWKWFVGFVEGERRGNPQR